MKFFSNKEFFEGTGLAVVDEAKASSFKKLVLWAYLLAGAGIGYTALVIAFLVLRLFS